MEMKAQGTMINERGSEARGKLEMGHVGDFYREVRQWESVPLAHGMHILIIFSFIYTTSKLWIKFYRDKLGWYVGGVVLGIPRDAHPLTLF
jgi:hypothetical protein